jgi:hypothetical protein
MKWSPPNNPDSYKIEFFEEDDLCLAGFSNVMSRLFGSKFYM